MEDFCQLKVFTYRDCLLCISVTDSLLWLSPFSKPQVGVGVKNFASGVVGVSSLS